MSNPLDPVLAGAYAVPFVKKTDEFGAMGARAVRGLLAQTGLTQDAIDTAVVGAAFTSILPGQRILKHIGMTGIAILNVENACATGASAVHVAANLVRTGQARAVVVVGAEMLSALGGGALPLDITDIEVAQGAVMPAVYAMRAARYMHENSVRPEDLAAVSVKNRANAVHNPIARFRTAVTVDDVLSSPMICDPLTLLQCSPNCDGAGAVLICSREFAKGLSTPIVEIRASIITSGQYSTAPRDVTMPEITIRAIQQAYDQAGITADDVDLAEVHDAFSIAELLYYEALGFCRPGTGAAFLAEGGPMIDGKVAVNPSGGLIARGHPVGATGVAQIIEAYQQLTGVAGGRQVPNAQVAVTHVTGGGIAGFDNGACAVHVLAN